jgi:hypothetical protein
MSASLRKIKIDNPVGEVVTLLEDLLARARAGEILGIIGVILNRECLSESFNTNSLEIRDACFALRKLEIQIDGLIADR